MADIPSTVQALTVNGEFDAEPPPQDATANALVATTISAADARLILARLAHAEVEAEASTVPTRLVLTARYGRTSRRQKGRTSAARSRQSAAGSTVRIRLNENQWIELGAT